MKEFPVKAGVGKRFRARATRDGFLVTRKIASRWIAREMPPRLTLSPVLAQRAASILPSIAIEIARLGPGGVLAEVDLLSDPSCRRTPPE